MSLDLTNDQHRKALRLVCDLFVQSQSGASVLARLDATGAQPIARTALAAICSPMTSTILIGALLERCGVEVRGGDAQTKPEDPWSDCVVLSPRDGGGVYYGHFFCREGSGTRESYSLTWVPIAGARVPAVVLALLETKDRTAALAACEEYSR